jgi:hypothetical protein
LQLGDAERKLKYGKKHRVCQLYTRQSILFILSCFLL